MNIIPECRRITKTQKETKNNQGDQGAKPKNQKKIALKKRNLTTLYATILWATGAGEGKARETRCAQRKLDSYCQLIHHINPHNQSPIRRQPNPPLTQNTRSIFAFVLHYVEGILPRYSDIEQAPANVDK